MATKTTTVLSDMPGSATKNPHKLSDVVVKLVEQEEEIDREIDRLVSLRAEIYGVIQAVEDMDERLVLEMRYMGYHTVTEIARRMEVGERQIYRIHERGLQSVVVPS
ncbi:sigma-70 family RNA polymerase sigma factor [Selenomonas timonae]|uniref:Sigma-70 family RNA polymerase sigma factor n=2 Tax=Selenomonadaceae TaxID=1843491 RepID=A0A7G7VN01_9FIRM|nr:sigma-70 family RNA polymerase sigma factor [Selenomonas timonae]